MIGKEITYDGTRYTIFNTTDNVIQTWMPCESINNIDKISQRLILAMALIKSLL